MVKFIGGARNGGESLGQCPGCFYVGALYSSLCVLKTHIKAEAASKHAFPCVAYRLALYPEWPLFPSWSIAQSTPRNLHDNPYPL